MSRLALLLATLVLATGCTSSSDHDDGHGEHGDGTSSDSTSGTPRTENAPRGPECADVWKKGETLPDDYESCLTDGQQGAQEVVECEDGSRLVTYDVAYYAVTGGTIRKPDVAPLQDTDEYADAYEKCAG